MTYLKSWWKVYGHLLSLMSLIFFIVRLFQGDAPANYFNWIALVAALAGPLMLALYRPGGNNE